MIFQNVVSIDGCGRGATLPHQPHAPTRTFLHVPRSADRPTPFPSFGSGHSAIVVGAVVCAMKVRRPGIPSGSAETKKRRRAGGEEIFEGVCLNEGIQILLAEGLGPDVAKSYNERREKAAEVQKFVHAVLQEKEELRIEDRAQINRSMLWLEFLLRLDGLETWQPDEEAETESKIWDDISVQTLKGRRACLPAKVWNELLAPDDSPFLEHGFLQGLEETGCVSLAKGWQPRFLFACRSGLSGLQLVGAVPMYLKMHSEGEFCEEMEWIEASIRHRTSHWPRLFVGIPFTPHRGRRLITAAWLSAAEREEVEKELVRCLQAISVRANVGVNIAFPTEEEGNTLREHGFIERLARQAWWSNQKPEPYKDFRDFLRTLRLKNAREISKQRAELKAAGVRPQVIDGSLDPSAVTAELMSEVFFSCYVPTQLKNGNVETSNGEYRFDLSEDFFRSLGERIPHRILLILARDGDGRLLGGSLCFVKDGRIYGRYWGCAETELEVSFLHFECCYYAAIEHAIQHGYERIEPGNGGGSVYKVQRRRGFEPVLTCSFHFIPDVALREEVMELAQASFERLPDSWTVQRYSAYTPKPRDYGNAV